jgi:hypothetical protein
MSRLITAFVLTCLLSGMCFAGTSSKTFGKAPTIAEPTAITAVNKEPVKFADQTVLLTGTIVTMCQGAGCWVELQSPDSSRIICKSMDESIHFPKNSVGHTARVQGKVIYEKSASDKPVMKSENGEAPHACPAPKILVSIDGATVELADAAPATTEPAAAVKDDPAKPAESQKPTETDKKVESK